MVIGTHALITDKTEFKNLALAVTDEQHRFGVAQRAKLLGKGNNPHLLVMSATLFREHSDLSFSATSTFQ